MLLLLVTENEPGTLSLTIAFFHEGYTINTALYIVSFYILVCFCSTNQQSFSYCLFSLTNYKFSCNLQPIGKGGIVYNNSPWHRDCFCCSHCRRVLSRERFTSVEDKPYCVDCYGQLFAKKCCTCEKAITGKTNARFPSPVSNTWPVNTDGVNRT